MKKTKSVKLTFALCSQLFLKVVYNYILNNRTVSIVKKLLFILLIKSTLITINCLSQPITWERVMSYTDGVFFKAQQTSDGGYVAVGTNRIGNYTKIHIVKYSIFGDTVWTRYYDVKVNDFYDAYWVEETLDKGLIIGGEGSGAGGDAYMVKTDSMGFISWVKIYGGSGIDQMKCVKQTLEKGYISTIRTTSYGPTDDIRIVKTDSLGNTIWNRVFVDNSSEDFANEIRAIGNNGYIVIGTKWPVGDTADMYLIRLNSIGDTLWTKTIVGIRSAGGYSVDITNEGGFIIGGSTNYINNFSQSYIIKTDSNGNIQWQRNYVYAFDESCYMIRYIPNKGYVFCGQSDSVMFGPDRAFVRVIDFLGNVLIEKFFIAGNQSNRFNSVELTSDMGFILAGFSLNSSSPPHSYIVRSDSLGNIKPIGINIASREVPEGFELLQNFPNPFNVSTTIEFKIPVYGFVEFKIYDVTGRELITLLNETKKPGAYVINFNPEKYRLSSGVYFYRLLLNSTKGMSKKIIYLK